MRIIILFLLLNLSVAWASDKPNFVIILTDDQGFQDLGCYGSPGIRTPHIDRMVDQGDEDDVLLRQTVCGPSRAALMTGSYPLRVAIAELFKHCAKADAIAELLDIISTLCELTDLPLPEFAEGVSLLPQLNDPTSLGRPAYGYHGNMHTLRTKDYRFILPGDAYTELYDHHSEAGETRNIADQKSYVVEELKAVVLNRAEHRNSVLSQTYRSSK